MTEKCIYKCPGVGKHTQVCVNSFIQLYLIVLPIRLFFKQYVANMVSHWFESVAHCQTEEARRVVSEERSSSGILAISI